MPDIAHSTDTKLPTEQLTARVDISTTQLQNHLMHQALTNIHSLATEQPHRIPAQLREYVDAVLTSVDEMG